MVQYKKLVLQGPKQSLSKLVEDMSAALPPEWTRDTDAEESLPEYSTARGFYFRRDATAERHAARLFLAQDPYSLYVPNIVPVDEPYLPDTQANEVLAEFERIVLRHLPADGSVVRLGEGEQPTMSDFLSTPTGNLLSAFSNAANKSTGASQPLDHQRWLAFLIAAHRAGAMVDASALERLLVDRLSWPDDVASELAVQYELARDLLRAYEASQS